MRLADEFREAVVIAVGALRANKLRAGLTTLGIVIGIVTVTLMATAIDGLNQAFRRSISMIGADVLFIQRFSWFTGREEWAKTRNRRELTMAQAREVARLATGVRAVGVEAHGQADVRYGNRSARAVWVVGNSEDSAVVRGVSLSEGRWLSAAEVAGGAAGLCDRVRSGDAVFSTGEFVGETDSGGHGRSARWSGFWRSRGNSSRERTSTTRL
jgi:putative ABC transport system permease protein